MRFIFEVLMQFHSAGLFAFGGGMAVIPFFDEMVKKHGWLTESQFSEVIAIAQSAPGPVGVNMAVYAGNIILGSPWGGIVAALVLVLPGIARSLIVARVLAKYRENSYVRMAFYGIRPAAVALIASACMGLFVSVLFRTGVDGQSGSALAAINIPGMAIFAALLTIDALASVKGKPLSPILFIVASACLGVVLKL